MKIRTVTAHTWQYDVWDSSGSVHINEFPNDSSIGVSFTVFAASTTPHFFSGVEEGPAATNEGLLVWPSMAANTENVHSIANSEISRFTVTNILGVAVLQMELPAGTSDFKFET